VSEDGIQTYRTRSSRRNRKESRRSRARKGGREKGRPRKVEKLKPIQWRHRRQYNAEIPATQAAGILIKTKSKTPMKYFLKKDGKEIEAVPERWVWGVIYKPTAEATAEAAKNTEMRVENLKKEMEERIKAVVESGGGEDPVNNLKKHFEDLMNQPVEAFREEMHQFGEDGTFHQFKDIEQEQVEMFVMYKFEDMGKRIDLIIDNPEKQVFHFYRTNIFSAGKPEERRTRTYCFGYKNKETGEQRYNYILPDDRIVMSDKDLDITKFNI